MAAPNYEQIQSFGHVADQLKQAAIEEFMEYVYEGMTVDELVDAATTVAMKYHYLGCELGAQWYDLCSELAGLDVEPAYIPETDTEQISGRVKATVESSPDSSTIGEIFNSWLSNEIENSIRMTGSANLWRDYERGKAPGKWSRVPVGETCAWCLMLASQGAWYVSEKTALGADPGHYHNDCDCKAVYHADAESIKGYTELDTYKSMYYAAENARSANASGKHKYDKELAARVAKAKAEHDAKYEAGLTDKKWTKYNETLIVMRYQNEGLK